MVDKREKMIYYVSSLEKGTISIVDDEGYRIIKEIEVGPRPQNIIVDEENNVYIASDRNNKVTLIDSSYDSNKIWQMPNNGNIQVDCITQKIYVCNTEEVCIYSLKNGEKIQALKGFTAADDLVLDKSKKKLFVLDVLQNEIKVYDTSDFHLVRIYRNIGNSPKCILIEESEKHIYIANKGRENRNILILDIVSGDISYIYLEKGSVITLLEQNGETLYAANTGLHRIEVIDVVKKECITRIKTTLPKLQKFCLSPDKKVLLATSRNDDGKGVIDKIDTASNNILNTFTLGKNDGIPYNIGVINQNKFPVKKESFTLMNPENKLKQENRITILAKKVLSTYRERVTFSDVSIKLYPEGEGLIKIEEITFKKCVIANEKTNVKIIDKEHSILEYDFYIPYDVWYEDEQEQKYVTGGRVQGTQEATLYIPAYAEQQGVQFAMESFTKLTSTPVLINKNLQFNISVLISTRAIVDEILFIPSCENCNNLNNEDEV